jgi:glycoside/pentoside/hexuronide:cation symporter, GPH family
MQIMQRDLNLNDSKERSIFARIAYGVGDFGPSMAGNTLMVFFCFFLTTIAGLSPALAGIILCLSHGWSAISTLFIGVLSDRTQSRWGRRRIWMVGSAPLLGISFLLHWWIPPWQTGMQFVYFLGVALLFQTAGNAFTIPYGALLTDLTDDQEEHLRLNGFRFGFSLSGCLGSLLLAQAINHWSSQPQQQMVILGSIGAIVIVGSILCCCWGTEEQPSTNLSQPKPTPLNVNALFNNRPLILLSGIYAFSWMALQITPTVLPYFIVNCLNLQTSAIPTIVVLIQGTALLSLMLWEWLSRQMGKKFVFGLGTSLWILATLGLIDLQPGQLPLLYGLAILMGLGMSTVYLVPLSLLPEVADLDEQVSGQRREGLLYSILVFLQKIALALGLFIVGQLLAGSGFQEAIPGPVQLLQPRSALTMIRAITVVIPAISLLTSLLLMSLYDSKAIGWNRVPQLRRATASNSHSG